MKVVSIMKILIIYISVNQVAKIFNIYLILLTLEFFIKKT